MKKELFLHGYWTKKRILSISILFIGTGWITYKILQESNVFLSEINSFNVNWLIVSTVLGTFSVFVNGLIFAYLIKIHCKEENLSLFESMSLHFIGQVVRHLPGRFWGVIYQINEIQYRIDPVKVVKVNIDYMLIFTCFNVSVSIAIILFFKVHYWLGLLFFATTIVVFFTFLKIDFFSLILGKILHIFPQSIYKKVEKYVETYPYPYSNYQILFLLSLLSLSWGIYLFSWQKFSIVYPFLSSKNLLLLCALYTVSWFIGFISMITPSGWGVRESVFVALTTKVSAIPYLGIFTIFVRLWLLCIDFILFTIFITMQSFRKVINLKGKEQPPLYSNDGLNILDQNDTLGRKSEYITLLQEHAIKKYFPKGSSDKICVDVGCGYGRLSNALRSCHWQVLGIDPDVLSLQYARMHFQNVHFCGGLLPNLPLGERSVHCFVLHNVMRTLFLLNSLNIVDHIEKYVTSGGWLVVVDNIRIGDERYIQEKDIIQIFSRQEFELTEVIPIRQGRWWLLYCIRYGLIPRSLFLRIATYELKKRKNQKDSKYTYLNKIFLFQRK